MRTIIDMMIEFAKEGNTKVLKELKNKGFNLDCYNKEGVSLLYEAAENGHSETVKFLLDEGIDPNASLKGMYPLIIAARKGYYNIVKMLLDYQADINVQDQAGWTALMYASSAFDGDTNDRLKTVDILLDGDADVTIENDEGMVAKYIAEKYYQRDIRKKIEERGGKYNIGNCLIAVTKLELPDEVRSLLVQLINNYTTDENVKKALDYIKTAQEYAVKKVKSGSTYSYRSSLSLENYKCIVQLLDEALNKFMLDEDDLDDELDTSDN